jgi:zona occludens toxin
MILLISGVPGAGKTLRAISTALHWMEIDPDRPLFSNVDGWKRASPLPSQWMDVPDTSVVVIDEIQQRWRRQNGQSALPAEIKALETHRHRAVDFILTCQNPAQLQNEVRVLVERHEHLTRRGKLKGAVVTSWEGHCTTTPRRDANDSDAETSLWRYPQEVFKEYHSAVQHNEYRRLPRAMKVGLILAPLAVGGVAVAAFQTYSTLQGYGTETVKVETKSESKPTNTLMQTNSVKTGGNNAGMQTATGGMSIGGSCRIWNEEGETIPVTWSHCNRILSRGFPVDLTPRATGGGARQRGDA